MHTIAKIVAEYFIFLSGALAILGFVLVPKDKKVKFIIQAVVGAIIVFALAKLGSMLYNDPRPFVVGNFTPLIPHAADNGFPSDHTLLAAYLGWLIFKYNKWLGSAMLVLALGIGASRVYAGIHHWTDVIGSILIAGLGTLITFLITAKIAGGSQKPFHAESSPPTSHE